MHRAPDEAVIAWLDAQPRSSIWTTSITVLEVRFGLQIMPLGRRRSVLINAFGSILERMGQRVIPFDDAAADRAADLMAARRQKGRPGDLRDAMIAGIALAQHATLATRNTEHFADASIPLVNPCVPQ